MAVVIAAEVVISRGCALQVARCEVGDVTVFGGRTNAVIASAFAVPILALGVRYTRVSPLDAQQNGHDNAEMLHGASAWDLSLHGG